MTVSTFGCESEDTVETQLSRLSEGYVRTAAAHVGDAAIDLLSAKDGGLGPFILVARDRSGKVLDYCQGEFRGSTRPVFMDKDRVALVASIQGPEREDALFIFDGRSDSFAVFKALSVGGCGVHENIVIVGDRVYFAACKTVTPIGCLNLATREIVRYGSPARQSADFFMEQTVVLTPGEDGNWYEIGDTKLKLAQKPAAAAAPVSMAFGEVFKPVGVNR